MQAGGRGLAGRCSPKFRHGSRQLKCRGAGDAIEGEKGEGDESPKLRESCPGTPGERRVRGN